MINIFSERVEKLLRSAGWSESRKINITDYTLRLKEFGFEIFPAAEAVLQNFSGLVIEFQDRILTFGVAESLKLLEPQDRRFLDGLINEPLCPFGYGERMLEFISPTGRIISLHDEWTVYYCYENIKIAFDEIFFPSFGKDMKWLNPEQVPPGYR